MAAAVFSSDVVAQQLCPALMHVFRAVDAVEGLDVDKEIHFDKHSVRAVLAELMTHLWRHPAGGACRAGVAALAAKEPVKTVDFLGALLDCLLYMMDDALHKVVDVYRLERSGSDPRFMTQQQQGAAAMMRGGEKQLKLLLMLAEVPAVLAALRGAPAFTQRLADVLVGFVDVLHGDEKHMMDVKNPAKTGLHKARLTRELLVVAVRVAGVTTTREHPNSCAHFIECLAASPDFSEGVWRVALECCSRPDTRRGSGSGSGSGVDAVVGTARVGAAELQQQLTQLLAAVLSIQHGVETESDGNVGSTSSSEEEEGAADKESEVEADERYSTALSEQVYDAFCFREGSSDSHENEAGQYAHHYVEQVAGAGQAGAAKQVVIGSR